MSRGFPSMTALLGLLSVAGYQHRDKIAEVLGGIGQGSPGGTGQKRHQRLPPPAEREVRRCQCRRLLSGELGELVDRFKQSGHGETAESGVGTGPNKPVTPLQLEQAIGPEVSCSQFRRLLSEAAGSSNDFGVAGVQGQYAAFLSRNV